MLYEILAGLGIAVLSIVLIAILVVILRWVVEMVAYYIDHRAWKKKQKAAKAAHKAARAERDAKAAKAAKAYKDTLTTQDHIKEVSDD